MPHSEARAWWADVQHLRDDYDRTDEARRRADEADLASRRAMRERPDIDAEVSSVRATPASGDAAHAADAQPRRAADTSFAARRGPTDGGLDPRRGHHVDLPPAPRVRQGIAPPSGTQRAPRAKGAATPGRVTVEIRGRTVPAPAVPRPLEFDRQRPQRRAVERVGPRPDRVAMWALLMGLLLILVAIGTADAPAVSSLLLR
jgi:hypothetical protein